MKRKIDEISSGGVGITGSRRAIIISSDALLIPEHKQWVENAWDKMLDNFKLNGENLDDTQKENIKKVRDFFNQCKLCDKESISKKVDEFVNSNPTFKLYKTELSEKAQNPADLIAKSIAFGLNLQEPRDYTAEDISYLDAYKKEVVKWADKSQSKHSELAQALVEFLANNHICDLFRTPQKREIIRNGNFELMNKENEIFLKKVKVENFGLIPDPKDEKKDIRRPGLDDNLKEKDKILLLVEQAEFEKIAQSQWEQDKDYYKSYAKALFNNKDKITILVEDPLRKLSQKVLDEMEGFGFKVKQVEYDKMVENVKEFVEESKSPTAETTNRDPGGVPNPLKPGNSQGQSSHL